MREVKAGRGSPRGGVFLDISWIKKRLPGADAHIRRKLPSMYHQFKELADIDITKEPMEIGPTTHYIMGGVRVDSDTQMSNVPGLFAAGECAAGINGANRLGGNSLSDLLVFGKRAGEYAAQFTRENARARISDADVTSAVDEAVRPFENGQGAGENPYAVQSALQETMQNLVGIVRTESEMQHALTELGSLKARGKGGRHRASRIQSRVAHLDRLEESPDGVRGDHAIGIERKESRGGHFREDFPDKAAEFEGSTS
jgi:succinate dehydrogenase / fumarate reductase flavoprotein subunit